MPAHFLPLTSSFKKFASDRRQLFFNVVFKLFEAVEIQKRHRITEGIRTRPIKFRFSENEIHPERISTFDVPQGFLNYLHFPS